MAIRVSSAEKVGGVFGYTLYTIELQGGRKIFKRYSDFDSLRVELVDQGTSFSESDKKVSTQYLNYPLSSFSETTTPHSCMHRLSHAGTHGEPD